MKSPLLFSIFLLISFIVEAQKYSNEFLYIGVSAAAQARGNAVVADVSDVTAGYWNPAGLVNIPTETGLQLGAMHAEWFAGVGKFDYAAMSVPFSDGKSRMGISVIRFGIDNIPNTLSLFEDDGTVNYDNIIAFSAADYAFLGSYARQLKETNNGIWSVGGNIKLVRRSIGSFANSWGFGLDLGAQYKSDSWRLGFVARDVTTTYNNWVTNFTEQERQVLAITGNDIPISSVEITKPSLQLGVGYLLKISDLSITPEIDFIANTDGQRNYLISANPISVDLLGGIEIDYKNLVAVRAGVNQFQRESDFERENYLTARPSVGVGLHLSNLQIDYAFTDLGDSRNTFSHVISLTIDLKKKD
ncbi:MAG: PorV/PorQ family protein [Bacteroidota bacterium]